MLAFSLGSHPQLPCNSQVCLTQYERNCLLPLFSLAILLLLPLLTLSLFPFPTLHCLHMLMTSIYNSTLAPGSGSLQKRDWTDCKNPRHRVCSKIVSRRHIRSCTYQISPIVCLKELSEDDTNGHDKMVGRKPKRP